MNIDILCENNNNCNTYIVGNLQNVIIIDPANDERSIKKLVNNRNVLGIFLTHGHYDHFKKLHKLLKIYNVFVYMHKNAYLKLADVYSSCAVYFGCNEPLLISKEQVCELKDGETIDFGDVKVKVIFTPGHTNCSVCLKIDDVMFTGDTMFFEGVGRWDLPTASSIQLTDSINKLLKSTEIEKIISHAYLKIDYCFYPGHGESSTCFHEIKNNSYYIRNKRG